MDMDGDRPAIGAFVGAVGDLLAKRPRTPAVSDAGDPSTAMQIRIADRATVSADRHRNRVVLEPGSRDRCLMAAAAPSAVDGFDLAALVRRFDDPTVRASSCRAFINDVIFACLRA